MTRTRYFRWEDNDDIHFVLEQHAYLECYNVTSLKQQSMSVHVGTLSWFSDNQSLLEFFNIAVDTNFIIFVWTWQVLKQPTIYHIRVEHAKS
jgi:hypothetical protein